MGDSEGKRLGDGKTSPFGDGKGATATMGSSKGGNDFSKNPSGSASKGGGNDFGRNPAGNADRSGGIGDPSKLAGPKAPTGEDAPDVNQESKVEPSKFYTGKPLTPPDDHGTGSIGNAKKPFRLNG